MNVHHLELFHYVALHGGISQAARRMPYGIQQPAISGQLRRLEADLGVKLFERSPFRLTPEGRKLQRFVAPFFGRLDDVARELKAARAPALHLGAAEVILHDHVPGILRQLRPRFPGLRVRMRDGLNAQLIGWLEGGEIDLIIVPLGPKPPPRLRRRTLLGLPPVLLVPDKGGRRSAADWWAEGPQRPPLISLPASEPLTLAFQRELRRRKIRWPVTIEANSLPMVTRYVADGQGAGISLAVPGLTRHRGVRACPLPGFPPLEIAALWRDEPTPVVAAFVDEAVRQIAVGWHG